MHFELEFLGLICPRSRGTTGYKPYKSKLYGESHPMLNGLQNRDLTLGYFRLGLCCLSEDSI